MKTDKFNGFIIGYNSCRPKSLGRITLNSPNPDDSPLIDPNFLSDDEDTENVQDSYSTPPSPPQSNPNLPPPPSSNPQNKRKARRWIKNSVFRRKISRKLKNNLPNLTTNYSDINFEGTAMERYTNRGLNHCEVPPNINRTGIEAGIKRMTRSLYWKEYFLNNAPSDGP